MEISRLKPTAGAGRAFYNPRRLPQFLVGSAYVGIKAGAATTTYAASTTTFFAQLANAWGAVCTLTDADTYATLVDITGAGWLGWVLSATCKVNDQVHTQSIRFTVDGQEYVCAREITEAAAAFGSRNVVGGAFQGSPATATSSYAWGILGIQSTDYGFGTLSPLNLSPTQQIMAAGGATLRFDRSLKIEVKSSVLDAVTQYNQAACDYALEG